MDRRTVGAIVGSYATESRVDLQVSLAGEASEAGD